MNPIGRARVENEVVDQSFITTTGLEGIPALIGPTQWGIPGESVLVGSVSEYESFFGGPIVGELFPTMVRRMLDRGSKVRVSRAAHYTNAANASTLTGVKASATLTVSAVTATSAEWENKILTYTANDTWTFTLGGVLLAAIDTTGVTVANAAAVKTYLVSEFANNTVDPGYTLVSNGVNGEFKLIGPAGQVADNTKGLVVSAPGGTTGAPNLVPTTLAIAAVPASSTAWQGFSFGTWANGTTVTVKSPLSENAGVVDLEIVIPGFDSQTVYLTDVTATLTAADVERINNASYLIKLGAYSGTLTPSTVSLSSGTNGGSIVTADYIGDETAITGIHSFDEASDFIRISVPTMADPTLDAKLVQYVTNRGDCRAWLRTPVGITGRVGVDYRRGTGTWSHDAIDTWRASMVFGELNVNEKSTLNPSEIVAINMPALTEVLANASIKDSNTFNWYSTAGPERGKIPGTNGVNYNLGVSARAAEFDLVDQAGLNAVIKDSDFGTVYWGNGTLQIAKTLLSHENIAELLIFLTRTINPIARGQLFNPNEPSTWLRIFRRVKNLMDFVKDNRGVYDWEYQGDQLVGSINDVEINTPNNIAAGQYIFHLFIAPTPAMKYVGIKTIVTNVGVTFELL